MNTWVTTAIANSVANDNASILLWTGDIANINEAKDGLLEAGIDNWRTSMKPLYDKKVKVWPVRGNHEVYRYISRDNYDGTLIPDSEAIWKKKFPELSQNEPKSDDGLSFYSVEGPALIVGLDQYKDASDDVLKREHKVNQTWLDQVLQKNQQRFKFVYGHEAAFMAGRHAEDDTLAANTVARNSFWQSLVNARAIYFCGHDHFYDRMSVKRNGHETFQITAGTAGAPFYSGGQYASSAVWKEDRTAHFDNVYGYILIKVDEDKAIITFKGAPPAAFSETGTVTFTPMDQIVCDGTGCKMIFCGDR